MKKEERVGRGGFTLGEKDALQKSLKDNCSSSAVQVVTKSHRWRYASFPQANLKEHSFKHFKKPEHNT